MSLSSWSWQQRAPCPLSQLDRKPSLFLNSSFYLFGQKTDGKDIRSTAVALFDPLQNEWQVLDGYGPLLSRFAIVNTQHGVIIVDGKSSNEMTQLCQLTETNVTCSNMEINEPEVLIEWNGETILFTFDHESCPESVQRSNAMLLVTSYELRNEFRKK